MNTTQILLTITLIALASEGAFAEASYKQLDKSSSGRDWIRLTYEISEKVSKEDLEGFVKKVNPDYSAKYGKAVVFFMLPGMLKDNGCWARADLKTKMVTIFGTTAEQEAGFLARKINADKIAGKWMDDQTEGHLVVIYSQGGKAYVGRLFPGNPQIVERELTRIEPKNEMRFKLADGEDVYVITKNGDLEIHDSAGLVASLPKATGKSTKAAKPVTAPASKPK
jgi:hypothetical protein